MQTTRTKYDIVTFESFVSFSETLYIFVVSFMTIVSNPQTLCQLKTMKHRRDMHQRLYFHLFEFLGNRNEIMRNPTIVEYV